MAEREEQRLYLMENAFGMSKIGISTNPERRRRQLENAAGVPVYLIKCWRTTEETAYKVEQDLHVAFSRRRMGGEWFSHISLADIEFFGHELIECNSDGSTKRIKE